MDIYRVKLNLLNTIAAKEEYLAQLKEDYLKSSGSKDPGELGVRLADHATIKFLELNIRELKSLLVDVEICCKQASDASWALNPDRMGQ